MSGLIRGKRLVWVRDGNCWRAESQFGIYEVFESKRWYLSPLGDMTVIHEGHGETIELAQAACQADHDQRAIASVEVVPVQWRDTVDGACGSIGSLTLRVWKAATVKYWRWDVRPTEVQRHVADDYADDKQAASTAAEQFVRQLVMGVQ